MRVLAVAVAAALGLAALAIVALGHPGRADERYVSVEWFTDPDEAGRKIALVYHYRGFACQYRFHRASARETSETVTIKVLAHRREMRSDEACTLELGGGRTVVRLREPLGDRELRHAPVNDSRR